MIALINYSLFISVLISHIAFQNVISACDSNTNCDPNMQPQTRFSRHPSHSPYSHWFAGAFLLPCHSITPVNITGVSPASASPRRETPGLIHACHVLLQCVYFWCWCVMYVSSLCVTQKVSVRGLVPCHGRHARLSAREWSGIIACVFVQWGALEILVVDLWCLILYLWTWFSPCPCVFLTQVLYDSLEIIGSVMTVAGLGVSLTFFLDQGNWNWPVFTLWSTCLMFCCSVESAISSSCNYCM